MLNRETLLSSSSLEKETGDFPPCPEVLGQGRSSSPRPGTPGKGVGGEAFERLQPLTPNPSPRVQGEGRSRNQAGLKKGFVFLRRFLVGEVLLYVAVCLWLGGTARAKPALLYGSLGWLMLFLLWHRVRSAVATLANTKNVLAPRLELLASNLAFTLVLAEGTLQIFAAISGQSFFLSNALQVYKLTPGQDYGHGLVGNRLGYPGRDSALQKASGTFRIAALGDSFAVGPAVPFADNYLTVLEKKLPHTEVLNFGVSGAGPRDYYTILEQDVWQFAPDLVLVSLFVGNDITESLATPRHLAPQNHALYLLCQRGWRQLFEKQRQGTFAVASDRLAQPPLSPQTFLEVEARRLQICQTPPTAALEQKWQSTFSYLEKIVQSCRTHHIEVRFVLIPDEFQVNPHVLQQALAHAQLASDSIDLHLPQQRLCDFCQQQHLACLDLLPIFQGRTNLYAPWDTHWNRDGNHLAAAELIGWLGEGKGK